MFQSIGTIEKKTKSKVYKAAYSVSLSQKKFSCENILLRGKGFRSRGAHRTSPCKELKTRYMPPFLTEFDVKGISP